MRSPYTELYVHMVWATWDREPLVTEEIKGRLAAAMAAKCHELGTFVIAIGLMPDHAHLLVRMPPVLSVSMLAKEVKGASSHLVTHEIAPGSSFKWQGAYGAFTLGAMDLAAVKAYVLGQERHHADGHVRTEWEVAAREGNRSPGD